MVRGSGWFLCVRGGNSDISSVGLHRLRIHKGFNGDLLSKSPNDRAG